jgi:hypothetical protein
LETAGWRFHKRKRQGFAHWVNGPVAWQSWASAHSLPKRGCAGVHSLSPWIGVLLEIAGAATGKIEKWNCRLAQLGHNRGG